MKFVSFLELLASCLAENLNHLRENFIIEGLERNRARARTHPPQMSRRKILQGLAASPLAIAGLSLGGPWGWADEPAPIALGPAMPFDRAWLRQRARVLAAEPYRGRTEELPKVLAELSYDQLRDIRFRTDQALWSAEAFPFRAQFFHLGALFDRPVHIFEVAGGEAREVLYRADLFDYGANTFEEKLPEFLGFAGFRLHASLNSSDYLDEFSVFKGASYFRAVGQGMLYGLSARGLAIDTARPQGEEFPDFTAFWLERPTQASEDLTVHALLDGPSVAGAFTFKLRPGQTTAMDVSAALYPRNDIDTMGIAPLTSMFLFSPNDRVGVDDFRPRVHDSDGLSMVTGTGERIWRPLVNPETLRLSFYADENPRGFGLLQRARGFEDFQDLEARYDLRPSLWVEPLSPFGRGVVQLVEIPTDYEIHDNIVAFWRPERAVRAGEEWLVDYRLHWCVRPPVEPAGAEAVETRIGRAGIPGSPEGASGRKFVIDFEGGILPDLGADSPVEAMLSTNLEVPPTSIVQRNYATGGWRVFFDIEPDGSDPVELRCFLRLGDETLSETWSYQWTA